MQLTSHQSASTLCAGNDKPVPPAAGVHNTHLDVAADYASDVHGCVYRWLLRYTMATAPSHPLNCNLRSVAIAKCGHLSIFLTGQNTHGPASRYTGYPVAAYFLPNTRSHVAVSATLSTRTTLPSLNLKTLAS